MHLGQQRTQRSIVNEAVVTPPRQPEQQEPPEMPGSPEGDDQQTPPTQRAPMTLRKLYDTLAGSNEKGSDLVVGRTRSGNLPSRIVIGSALWGVLRHDDMKRQTAALENLRVGERITVQAALTLSQGMANLLPVESITLKQATGLLECLFGRGRCTRI